jgi:hypothetical protein
MPIVGKWLHGQGYSSSSAVFVITRLLIDFSAETFWVDFGVWENMRAFESKGPVIHSGQAAFSFDEIHAWPGLGSDYLDFINVMEEQLVAKEEVLYTKFLPKED